MKIIYCQLCDHVVRPGDDPTEEVDICILDVGFNDNLCEPVEEEQ